MLTDIFARRYKDRPLFANFGPDERAFLVQAYRIINEQVFPYYNWEKKVDERAKAIWTSLHDRLSLELGMKELAPRYYSYQRNDWAGKPYTISGWYEINLVCESWLTLEFQEKFDADVFVKRRLSFVELALREREKQVAEINAKLPEELRKAAVEDAMPKTGMRIPGSSVNRVQHINQHVNKTFAEQVHELNTRFEQAGMPLHYHNGYIQIKTDEQLQKQVEEPFWLLVKDAKWQNVSVDMAEAIDRRDTGGRDPAFYAAKALESTIKIICNDKKWTTGNEKGAADFLNHLEKKANGPFIDGWERNLMQRFFTEVRNELGHGPGDAPMPALTAQQTDFAIECCMSWVKSLIKRI